LTSVGGDAAHEPATMALILLTLVAALATNFGVVGLNQIVDVPLDRINKPDLPLASGTLRRSQATSAVVAASTGALLLGAALGPTLLATLATGLVIGAAYSLPPLRLRASAPTAAGAIAAVRGLLLNLGIYAHLAGIPAGAWFGAAGGRLDRVSDAAAASAPALPGIVWTLTAFGVLFSLGVAIGKDVPDVEGDARHGVLSWAVTRGRPFAFRASTGFLTAAFVVAGAGSLVALVRAGQTPTLILPVLASHAALVTWFVRRAAHVHPADDGAFRRLYAAVWRLYCVEYVLLATAALIAVGVS
jgi:homogentisate phytyltransferase/homogentisate geranylgeranyltransferase